MAETKVYVAVNADDPTDMVIKLGPLLWDGETEYNPGPQYRLVLEVDALAQGYVYPPPEGGGDPGEPPSEG
ncbi:hypothetical protein [Streptomyces sp. or20]|uniref:hypothetical protein n=1 Tax=Streptomyces sp. or20 TaxID=1828016 RepID=UPI000BF1153B|nr:hypothetical protein [Streptomyces sp. or20]